MEVRLGKRVLERSHFSFLILLPQLLLRRSDSYAIQDKDKSGAKRVDLLRGQKMDKWMYLFLDNVLAAMYEEAREEKVRSQRKDFSNLIAENEKRRKQKMHEIRKRKGSRRKRISSSSLCRV